MIFRYNIINYLINRYNFQKYLEIGVFTGENISKVNAVLKHGVDPGAERVISNYVTHKCTSDIFFSSTDSNTQYDIIFIDGLHHSDQVCRDISNSFGRLAENGFIVLHDCLPPSYYHQVIPRKQVVWTGDVWRAFVGFRQTNLLYRSLVVDTDFGVGVIKNDSNIKFKDFKPTTIDYRAFERDTKELLNLMTYEEFIEINI